MPQPSDAAVDASPSAVRLASGILAASALLAVADAAGIALTVPVPGGGLSLRAAHHALDAAETLGVGAVAAVTAGGLARVLRAPRVGAAIAVAVVMVLVYAAIGEDLTRMASLSTGGHLDGLVLVLYVAVFAVGIVGAFALGRSCAGSPRWRVAAVAVSLGAIALDHVPFPDDYFGIHGVLAAGAATLGGGALGPSLERLVRRLAAGRAGRLVLGVVAALGVAGSLVPPSNAARCELFRERCAVAPWVLATVLWRAPSLHGAVASPGSAWTRDRSHDPPVAPSWPALLPEDAVVVLVTVDAVGARVVSDPANGALLPTLAELKRDGVVFSDARAPATQTALSLATLFSGRYFSELYWTDRGTGGTRYLYPAEDPAPRFPQLLSDHGVTTGDYAGLTFFAAEYGVLRGFREETVTVQGRRHALAQELIDPLLRRLTRAEHAPLFLYTHLLEPHAPYDRGRADGTPYERYLSEVAVADGQLRRVLRVLQSRFGQRWLLMVSADHGEAFGEHGGTEHGKTLYEELLRVPLLVRSPLLSPRTVSEPVSLVDLGPTILDLFGVETPGAFEGQSLVPLLTGREGATLSRPILAEGRLRRARVAPDGLKVIEDARRKCVEAYDLRRDPGETQNLFDVEPARVDPALAELRAFFAAHARTEGGYRVPYKP